MSSLTCVLCATLTGAACSQFSWYCAGFACGCLHDCEAVFLTRLGDRRVAKRCPLCLLAAMNQALATSHDVRSHVHAASICSHGLGRQVDGESDHLLVSFMFTLLTAMYFLSCVRNVNATYHVHRAAGEPAILFTNKYMVLGSRICDTPID